MVHTPKISIVTSTYNRKELLPRSIESVLSQSYENFEYILVNNGSTDGSDEVCKLYAKQDSRINVITVSENRGISSGRNAGLQAASTNYITFVDDDDFCEPGMVEFLWNLRNEYNADISISGSWNSYPDRQEPYFIFDELLVLDKIKGLDELLKREKYNVAPPTKLFRKSLFEGIRFKENVLVDDIHVIYKIFAKANLVVAHGKPMYRFTKHGGNATSFIQTNILSPEILTEYLSAFRERTAYLSAEVPEIAMRAGYSEWSYMVSMCAKIKKYDYSSCALLYDLMMDLIRQNHSKWIDSTFITEKDKEFLAFIL